MSFMYVLLVTSLILSTFSDDDIDYSSELSTTIDYYYSNNTTAGIFDDPESDDAADLVVYVISLVIAGLGLIGNSLVIGLFLLNWGLTRTLTSLYIFHQSVIDFCTSMLFAAYQLDQWKPLLDLDGLVGVVSCKVWYSKAVFWALHHTSTINLVLVTMERYISVLHPICRRAHFTRRKAKLTMVLAWVGGLSYQSYWLVVTQRDKGQCYQKFPSTTWKKVFGGLTVLLEYLIPLSVMSFAYVRIISRLKRLSKYEDRGAKSSFSPKKSVSTVSSSPSNVDRRRRSTGPTQHMLDTARRNVTKTLCFVFATYVICWTPVEIEYVIYSAGLPTPDLRVTKILLMCNMCINPFIYAAKYREFQIAAKDTWHRCCCAQVPDALPPPSPSSLN